MYWICGFKRTCSHYIAAIPQDPQAIYPGTGYEVVIFSSKALVSAPLGELPQGGSGSTTIYSGRIGSPSYAGLSCSIDPQYDSQWIVTSESDALAGVGCLQGYTHRGYVQMPDSSYQSLCTIKTEDPEGGVCDDDDELAIQGWTCEGAGDIVYSSTEGVYSTQAEAEAARIPVYGTPPFSGGQCTTSTYIARGRVTDLRGYTGASVDIAAGPLAGPITEAFITAGSTWNGYWGVSQIYSVTIRNAAGQESTGSFSFSVPGSGQFLGVEVSSGVNNCGDPQGAIESYTCPIN